MMTGIMPTLRKLFNFQNVLIKKYYGSLLCVITIIHLNAPLVFFHRFKDVVECERIVVKAFKTPHEVCSYRASKLPDDFYTTKAEMDRRKTTMFSNQTDTSKQNTQDMLLGE